MNKFSLILSKENEVVEIWEDNKNLEIFVLLNINKYDPKLMHKFFNLERKERDFSYSIHYLPVDGIDRIYLNGLERVY